MSDRLDAIEENLLALMQKVASFSASEYHKDSRNLQYTTIGNGYSLSSGDTGFMTICTALVLMMTIPGLGLYYSGMVSVKNVLATVMQSFAITCLITCLFMLCGYSLAFGPPGKGSAPLDYQQHSPLYIGDGSRLWYWGLGSDSAHMNAASIPESVFATYQLTFAIITCALICGSFADRMKFSSMLVFMGLWHICIYCPIAHSNWHHDGFLFKAGVMDFAGGNTVHIASGMAGLMSTIVIGNRHGFGKNRFDPHNILLTFIGASLLWVGWFGFNAGSAVAANALAGQAGLNTQIATSMAAISWMSTEWIIKNKPSVLGMLSGAIAGLVAITPACGWVDQTGAFFIGLFAGPWCYGGAQIKHYAGYDDALDAFGVHATGGILGGILTGFFASPASFGPFVSGGSFPAVAPDLPGSVYYPGVFYAVGKDYAGIQLKTQLYGIACTILYSSVGTLIILKLVDLTIGLRVSEEDELLGLDASLHGESILGGPRHKSVPTTTPPQFAEAAEVAV
jgi:Amt family ammonium transporter